MSQSAAAAPAPDEGKKKKVLENLNRLVVERLRFVYEEARKTIPKKLDPNKSLLVSSLENYLKTDKGVDGTVDRDAFQEFRKRKENERKARYARQSLLHAPPPPTPPDAAPLGPRQTRQRRPHPPSPRVTPTEPPPQLSPGGSRQFASRSPSTGRVAAVVML